jgi:glycolate oxidase
MEDVSVPMASIPELLYQIRVSGRSPAGGSGDDRLRPVAGDGNVHVSFIKCDMPEERYTKPLRWRWRSFYAKTTRLGGCNKRRTG